MSKNMTLKESNTTNIRGVLCLLLVFMQITNLEAFIRYRFPIMHINSFLSLVILFLSLLYYLKNHTIKYTIPIPIIFLYMLILFHIGVGILNNGDFARGKFVLNGILQNIIIILLITSNINDIDMYNKLMFVIRLSAYVLSILGILEFFNIFTTIDKVSNWPVSYMMRVGTTWINSNAYGKMLVLSYFATIQDGKVKVNIIILKLLIFIGILFSMSRSALVVFVITVVIEFFYKSKLNKRKLLYIIIVGLLFFNAIKNNNVPHIITKIVENSKINRINIFSQYDTGNFDSGRIAALDNSLNIIKANPLFGKGIGNVTHSIASKQNAHNIYTQIWAESGVFSFTTYLLLIIYLLNITIDILKKNKGIYSKIVLGLFLYIFIYGFFDHNLINSINFGLAISIILVIKDLLINSQNE